MDFPTPKHPALNAVHRHRAAKLELRVADLITAFAGTMKFVYIHVIGFTAWMLLAEKSPWPTLTLVVSLEAIFLSTFILIASNRQSDLQRAKADHDYVEQEQELKGNTEITRAVHDLQMAMGLAIEELNAKIDGLPRAKPPVTCIEGSPLLTWVETSAADLSMEALAERIGSILPVGMHQKPESE
jgi:uncharacterized membrane protein